MNLFDPEAAIATYGQATIVESSNPRYWIDRANARSQLASALELYEKQRGLGHSCHIFGGPSSERLEQLLETENPTSYYERALEDFSTALRCDPNRVDAHKGRAAVFTKMGKEQDAKQAYGTALDILSRALNSDPNDVDSLEDRASVLKKLGRKKEAEAALRAAVERRDTIRQ